MIPKIFLLMVAVINKIDQGNKVDGTNVGKKIRTNVDRGD